MALDVANLAFFAEAPRLKLEDDRSSVALGSLQPDVRLRFAAHKCVRCEFTADERLEHVE
jgi:hypothetical protein